jgi:hypothetical protein
MIYVPQEASPPLFCSACFWNFAQVVACTAGRDGADGATMTMDAPPGLFGTGGSASANGGGGDPPEKGWQGV